MFCCAHPPILQASHTIALSESEAAWGAEWETLMKVYLYLFSHS